MNRQVVYTILDEERVYQDKIWKGKSHDLGNWIIYMEHYLNRAKKELSTETSDIPALHQLRKLVALGVACFEQHGVPSRAS